MLTKKFSVMHNGTETIAASYTHASQIAAAKLKPGDLCFVVVQIFKPIGATDARNSVETI
jgi:hypothetical protein